VSEYLQEVIAILKGLKGTTDWSERREGDVAQALKPGIEQRA